MDPACTYWRHRIFRCLVRGAGRLRFQEKKTGFLCFFAFLARFLITNSHLNRKKPVDLGLPAHYIQPWPAETVTSAGRRTRSAMV